MSISLLTFLLFSFGAKSETLEIPPTVPGLIEENSTVIPSPSIDLRCAGSIYLHYSNKAPTKVVSLSWTLFKVMYQLYHPKAIALGGLKYPQIIARYGDLIVSLKRGINFDKEIVLEVYEKHTEDRPREFYPLSSFNNFSEILTLSDESVQENVSFYRRTSYSAGEASSIFSLQLETEKYLINFSCMPE